MATSCFSPAPTTDSTTHHHHHPRLSGFIAVLISSLTRLASKLKSQNGTSPRKFVNSVSHKAMKMVHRKSNQNISDREEALWQRAILMGDKCQPLDFSGVIYYDENGKQRSEPPPRSPRSPLFQARS